MGLSEIRGCTFYCVHLKSDVTSLQRTAQFIKAAFMMGRAHAPQHALHVERYERLRQLSPSLLQELPGRVLLPAEPSTL